MNDRLADINDRATIACHHIGNGRSQSRSIFAGKPKQNVGRVFGNGVRVLRHRALQTERAGAAGFAEKGVQIKAAV